MKLQETLVWADPLDMARGVRDDKWILLYSAMNTSFTGRYSILALTPNDEIISEDFTDFESVLTSDRSKFDNSWFGYLGYGLKNTLEDLPKDSSSDMLMPNLWMINFRIILVFDHHEKNIKVWAYSKFDLLSIPKPVEYEGVDCVVSEIYSNMTKSEYFNKVEAIKDSIKKGVLSQANLTRKFSGSFAKKIKPFDVFTELCKNNPAPYSSYMRLGETHIISSSPEQFIHIESDGAVSSRPIKGSAQRFLNAKWDRKSKNDLAKSEKDKAENLMIVDLMRNDFSRSCEIGSVNVESLFDVTSYSTIHHMSSTVLGKKRKDISSIDFVKACFPPGSMTGTPKIKAMELCSKLEKQERGIYSGVLGWLGGDGSVDLSVVIRTIFIKENTFEFQVGGAVVADSSPFSEWQETLVKANSLAKSIGVEVDLLKEL